MALSDNACGAHSLMHHMGTLCRLFDMHDHLQCHISLQSYDVLAASRVQSRLRVICNLKDVDTDQLITSKRVVSGIQELGKAIASVLQCAEWSQQAGTSNLPSCDDAAVDAPASSSRLTQATLPDRAAACNGVSPEALSLSARTSHMVSFHVAHVFTPFTDVVSSSGG